MNRTTLNATVNFFDTDLNTQRSTTWSEDAVIGSDPALSDLQYEGGMFSGNRTRGSMEVGAGTLEIVNASGVYDVYYRYSFDDKTCFFKYLNSDTDRQAATTGDSGQLDQGQGYPFFAETGQVTQDFLTIYLRDFRYKMRKPFLKTKYAGTNTGAPLSGVEGTNADIGGQLKPRVIGQVFNIEPVLVNTDRLIYQVDGAVGLSTGWSMTVYDMGVATWTAGANYTSLSDMQANPPLPGQYRVLPSLGCFRLGSQSGGRLTCDVFNPATVTGTALTPTAVTAGDLHAVVRQIVFEAGATSSPGFQPLSSYFVTSNLLNAPPQVGVYITTDDSGLDVLNNVLKAVQASADFIQDGTLSVSKGATLNQARVDNLTGSSWQVNLTEADIKGLRVIQTDDEDRSIPVWRVTVNYAKNWSPLTDNEIAGSASAARRNYLQQSFQSSVASDTTVQTVWPNSPELVIDTALVLKADADAEAARLLNLYKVRRLVLEVDIPVEYALNPASVGVDSSGLRISCSPGKIAMLTYPRFGLDAGKAFLIINRSVKVRDRVVTLTLWG